MVDHYGGGSYQLKVQTSIDGVTWTDAWSITPTADYPAQVVIISLGPSNGVGSSTFYISWAFAGNSLGIDYWYIDDINLNILNIENHPPNTPSKLSGPTSGEPGVKYNYTTSTTDPDGDKVRYGLEGTGDNTVDFWTIYYNSGATCGVTIVFDYPGTYYLRVKAEDEHGAQSGFSSVLTVVISPNTPPTVSITSPSSGATVSGSINIQGTAGDYDGIVTQVAVRIDSGSWWIAKGTISWIYSWDTTNVSDGSHTIYACSKDNNNAYSTFASVPINVSNLVNTPPNKPSKPTGLTYGKVGVSYSYESEAIDNNSDLIYYLFDWDDGTDSGWIGLYQSGDICQVSHIWNTRGNYAVKVKAKDVHNAESVWSDSLSVVMPKSKSISAPLFLQRLFQRFPFFEKIIKQIQ
jgi:hypothetical protein